MHVKLSFAAIVLSLIAGTWLPCRAQTATVDHLSQAQLMALGKDLSTQAESSNGSASKKLDTYTNHFTMIALREKSGGAEIHEHFADFFLIVKGHAVLMTGGVVLDPKVTAPGEILGSSLQKGMQQTLIEGDVIHIPAGVPHQLLLNAGDTLIYYVIKVKEK